MKTKREPVAAATRTKVWDLPTRLFHWALAGLVAGAYLTAKFGDINLAYHKWNGYAVLTLVAFRLLWGIFGSTTTRFASFVRGPAAALAYARDWLGGRNRKYLGHNPLGGWMVLLLLAALATQGTMGLFATDDILVNGPLKHTVSSATAKLLTGLHKKGFWIIVGLVALHVAAVLAYLVWKKENLVRPMITGYKPRLGHEADPAPRIVSWPWAVAALAAGALAVWGGLTLWPVIAG